MKTAIITGGGSGIGRALAIKLAMEACHVFIVGRRKDKLLTTQKLSQNKITVVDADISTVSGREKILLEIGNIKVDYLIHSAAIITPIKQFSKISLEDWRKIQSINVEGPLFLTQGLLPNLVFGSRILHVSSGLAHHPLAGMLAYCTSKAALHMLYKGLNLELNNKGIRVGSFIPGVVRTDLQMMIRSMDELDMPDIHYFRELNKNHMLRDPDDVAQIINNFLQNTSNRDFIEKDYNIDDLE